MAPATFTGPLVWDDDARVHSKAARIVRGVLRVDRERVQRARRELRRIATAALGAAWWVAAAAAFVVVRQGTPGMLLAGVHFKSRVSPGRLPVVIVIAALCALLGGLPAMVGDRLYTMDADATQEHVLCLDTATGETLWQVDAGEFVEAELGDGGPIGLRWEVTGA